MENGTTLADSVGQRGTWQTYLASDYLTTISYIVLPILVTLLLYVSGLFVKKRVVKEYGENLLLGAWSVWMPRMLHNALFAFQASQLIENGYAKFKDKTFQLIRNDGNMIILPSSLLEQFSSLPHGIASPRDAIWNDLLGSHHTLNLIKEGKLHNSIIQRRLTPKLALLAPKLEEELVAAIEEYFPSVTETGTKKWVNFQPHQELVKISARLSARALVGPELCRNEKWLHISVHYTETLFQTVVLLRLFPIWTQVFVRYLLPSFWQNKRYLKAAKDLLGPIIQELLDRSDRGEWTPANNDADSNVLCWLAETARGHDRDAHTLAHIEVLLAVASVHTTLIRTLNVIYELAADPALADELRNEIQRVHDAENGGWTHATYARLEKMDSVMRESQRMTPHSIIGPRGIFKESFTFDDGTHIPKGAYAAIPSFAIESDPKNTSNPETFDGLRSYRMRRATHEVSPDAAKASSQNEEFLFSSYSPTSLSFGYGRMACPGRFFASMVIKMELTKLLSEYDFKFKDGEARPKNFILHEFLFSSPWQWMQVRRRENGACPF